jgi:hypothetical protein
VRYLRHSNLRATTVATRKIAAPSNNFQARVIHVKKGCSTIVGGKKAAHLFYVVCSIDRSFGTMILMVRLCCVHSQHNRETVA